MIIVLAYSKKDPNGAEDMEFSFRQGLFYVKTESDFWMLPLMTYSKIYFIKKIVTKEATRGRSN